MVLTAEKENVSGNRYDVVMMRLSVPTDYMVSPLLSVGKT